ncbi:MAG: HK97 family phage prohead protease [Beijerinckiaceae bacterium]
MKILAPGGLRTAENAAARDYRVAEDPTGCMFAADADAGTFEGFVCIYNRPTNDWRQLEIRPHAFEAQVKKPESVRLLWQHDRDKPIGNWTKFEERNMGLYGYGELVSGVQQADEARALMKAGALDGISAGWMPLLVEPPTAKKGEVTIKGELREASLVTFPAFKDARIKRASEEMGEEISPQEFALLELAFRPGSIIARASEDDAGLNLRKFETALRDAGLASRAQAAKIAALVRQDARFAQLSEALRDEGAEEAKRQQQEKLAALMRAMQA